MFGWINKMKRKYGFLVKKTNTEVDLNITAMADIMVVLIVFVLKASANDAIEFQPMNEMNLPIAVTESKMEDYPRVEITRKSLFLNGKKIVDIQNSGILQLGRAEVVEILKELQVHEEKVKRNVASSVYEKKLLILADEYTPYDSIKKVIDISQLRGFSDYKFVAIKGGD